MPEEMMTYGDMQELLAKAREAYGNKNQILVCIEELNELACVLAKYPRYEDESIATQELHDKVLDEVADVFTILQHVMAIFELTGDDVYMRRCKKLGRLKKWLSHSNSMQETVDDRSLEDYCSGCVRDRKAREVYEECCVHCLKAQATEGKAPYKLTKEQE